MRLVRKTLSLMLTGSLVLSLSGAAPCLGELALAKTPKPSSGGGGLAIRIGQAKGLTHIDFPKQSPTSAKEDGRDLVLTFRRVSDSEDLAHLKIDPTQMVKSVATKISGGNVEVRLTLADGVESKVGRADGAMTISLYMAEKQDASAAQDQTPGARADPTPIDGRVKMQATAQGPNLVLKFPWRAPLGAAVFRRGDALWIVFDAKAQIDLTAAPAKSPLFSGLTAIEGRDFSAVRMVAPPTTLATVSAELGTWTIGLGPAVDTPPGPVKLRRSDESGVPALLAEVAGATGVFWVTDPAVGDKLGVVTAKAPAKGVPAARMMVDANLLASAQGLALSPEVDDLQVSTDGDLVRIARPKGLALSAPRGEVRSAVAAASLPQPAAMPALIDFDAWSNTGSASFLARYDQLESLAADEEGKGKAGGVGVRLALARFLVGSELSFEALGVLDMIGRADQTLGGLAEFRGLRGAARAMAGRYKDAQADFSSPVLADDPSSALWRGYVAEKLGDHPGARQQFSLGRRAMPLFNQKWRGRFARMDAEAALGVNDLATARNEASLAEALKLDPLDQQSLVLVRARLAEAQGQLDEALKGYDQVAASPYGALAAPAELHAVQIRLKIGKMTPVDAEASLDSLRFRWRGDATELEVVRTLGGLYLSHGRYREALDALRSANGRLPDLPAAVGISQDLSTVFKALFLDGETDGLQPIQALALFYDFKELTPIGADGDEMVRKLARRLVDVDLLDHAAELLKYQVDNRLDGVPKAQVSTDLAMIQLMNKRPEEALDALNNSRSTLLPTALNARRRVIEARAQVALGRYDDGLELLQSDKSPEAEELRGEIAWRQKNWAMAAPKFEAQLGDRWKNPSPLTPDEQGELVRAGTAYSLAGDDKSLARLRQRFGKLAETGTAPTALKVALEGVDGGTLTAADFARVVSDNDIFAGWISAMKKRFETEPSPFSGPGPQGPAKALTKAPTAAQAKSQSMAQTAPARSGAAPAKSGPKQGA